MMLPRSSSGWTLVEASSERYGSWRVRAPSSSWSGPEPSGSAPSLAPAGCPGRGSGRRFDGAWSDADAYSVLVRGRGPPYKFDWTEPPPSSANSLLMASSAPAESFGARLQEILKSRNMMKKDFAVAVGVTPVMVSYYVHNKSKPSYATL